MKNTNKQKEDLKSTISSIKYIVGGRITGQQETIRNLLPNYFTVKMFDELSLY